MRDPNKVFFYVIVGLAGWLTVDLVAATNKTFFSQYRSVGVKWLSSRSNDPLLSIHAQYMQSRSAGALGRYFGIDGKNSIQLNGDVANPGAVSNLYFLNRQLQFFNYVLEFKPERCQRSVALDLQFPLKKIAHNLAVHVAIPVVAVTHKLNHSISSFVRDPIATGADALRSFFEGEQIPYPPLFAPLVGNGIGPQERLRKLKFSSSASASGIADCTVDGLWHFYNTRWSELMVIVGATLPLSKREKADVLFEPLYGNHGHMETHVALQGKKVISQSEGQEAGVKGMVRYSYLFPCSQWRTPGIKGRKYGQYYLLGKRESQESFIPAANVITQQVRVYPQGSLGGGVQWYHRKGPLELCLAYQTFLQQTELLHPKGDFPVATYAIAHPVQAQITGGAGHQFGSLPADFDTFPGDWLSDKSFDWEAARSKTQLLHRIETNLNWQPYATLQAGVQGGVEIRAGGGPYIFLDGSMYLKVAF